MKRVLLATDKPFAKKAVDLISGVIKTAGLQFETLEKYKTPQELHAAVAEVDAMIVRSDIVDKAVVDAAKNLKIVVRAGAGYDNLDTKALKEKGIVAMNTPGQNSNAVAELAFGMMLYMARNLFDASTGTELRGKTLGIHAYGNVGRHMARIAKGFGMEIYAYDPFVNADLIKKDGVTHVATAAELYSKCQYISLHMPATAETKGSINFDLLSKMPAGAVLVNTARKEVICEKSLIRLFEERKNFRYVSDVPPDCVAEIAEKYKGRFYFTPKKMGAQTEEANNNAGIAAATQIVNFFEKGDHTFQVN